MIRKEDLNKLLLRKIGQCKGMEDYYGRYKLPEMAEVWRNEELLYRSLMKEVDSLTFGNQLKKKTNIFGLKIKRRLGR